MEAHGLISADVFDKSDPYAIIKCNEQTLKSKVMENAGNDPVWDQLFAFAVSSEITEATITLMDRDTFTPDDPLGDAVIPLEAVFKQGSVPLSKYKVIGSSGKEAGEVVVGLKFVPKE
ncbi:hypothetical protein KP509_06G009900 [Ceratopteris richardii]|nr:hypothetical protein KP509_06G009900 [Ceratopteris richardii]